MFRSRLRRLVGSFGDKKLTASLVLFRCSKSQLWSLICRYNLVGSSIQTAAKKKLLHSSAINLIGKSILAFLFSSILLTHFAAGERGFEWAKRPFSQNQQTVCSGTVNLLCEVSESDSCYFRSRGPPPSLPPLLRPPLLSTPSSATP